MPDIGVVDLAAACGVPLPPDAFPLERGKQPQAQAQQAAPDVCDVMRNTRLPEGLPIPGSEDWCTKADDIGRAFASIFNGVVGWIEGIDPTETVFNKLLLTVPEGGIGSFVAPVFRLWNTIVETSTGFVKSVFDPIKTVVRNALSVWRCLSGKRNIDAYFGVWIVRELTALLRDTELGWNLGPKITVGVNLDFPGLDAWLETLMNYYVPNVPADADKATEAWLLDRISKAHRDCIWQLHGHDPASYEAFALTGREQLDWREAIQYAIRTNPVGADWDDVLRKRGFVEVSDRTAAKEMYWELPGIADHLHWLTRNVFDTDYVRDYKLLDGFDTRFWPVFGPDLTALGMRQKYAEFHYAAHWIMPSPQQMLEFLYRSDEIQAATGKPFTLNDYQRILTEQDYNPLVRQWFAATAYSVPAISYVKAMYQQGVIGDGDLATYHKRLGYSQEDANRFADIDRLQKARMRAAQTGGWTTKGASTAWVRGQIDAQRHSTIFAGLGYTRQEAADARTVAEAQIGVRIMVRAQSKALTTIASNVVKGLKIGVMSEQQAAKALTDAGWPADFARGYVRVENAAAGMDVIQQGITLLRRHVLNGSVTFQDAVLQLTNFGLTQQAIARYIQVWRLLLTPHKKHRSASQIVSDVAQNHISTLEGITRLHNLGYDDADTRLFLADAQSKVVALEQKRQAAEHKGLVARQKALTAAAKQAEKTKKQIVASMVRDFPVSKMEKWLNKGFISKAAFRQRMTLYGFSREDIALRIREQCEKKGAACQDGQGEQGGTVPESGSGGAAAGSGSGGATAVPK